MSFLRGGLGLLISPSGYLLALALALTVWAKLGAYFTLDAVERIPGDLPALLGADFAVFLGLAALFVAGERIRSRLAFITIPLAVIALVIAGFNAFFLAVTGGQLSVGAIVMGVERTADAWHIATRDGSVPILIASGVGLLVLPFALRVGLRRRRPEILEAADESASRFAGVGAAFGLAVWLVTNVALGLPGGMGTGELAPNPLLRIYASLLRRLEAPPGVPTDFPAGAVQRWRLAEPDAVAALAAGRRPNVLFVVLESTRLDHVELPGAGWESPAATPNLHALAERGVWVEGARAVVPHTTKSLFSMECGRIPVMLPTVAEISLSVAPDCLARTLGEAGYETAFFQSAIGFFESRAALVDRLGYQHFEAWEQIQGEPLGYLASDDRSLGPAFSAWLDGREGGSPFYATLLTSATHHPYVVPDDVALPPGVPRRGAESSSLRYAKLVELEDALVGSLVEALRERGLLDETLVVVTGDHGEGLPGDRIRQHDNNFFEAGVLVPFVMAGPSAPRGHVARDVGLTGVASTILARLGVPSALPLGDLRFGADFFSEASAARPTPFGCYYYDHCLGWFEDGIKIVERPPSDESFYIDLAEDPEERVLHPLTGEMASQLRLVRAMAFSTYVPTDAPYPPARTLFGEWDCTAGQSCRHRSRPEQGFHERPGALD